MRTEIYCVALLLGGSQMVQSLIILATTLTPGVRRMPSAEEMALMQQLVAQAKDGLVGRVTPADSIQQAAGVTRPTTPDNSPAPLPIPLGVGFGMAFIGRMQEKMGQIYLSITK